MNTDHGTRSTAFCMGRSEGQQRAVSQSTATGSIRQGERDQSAAEPKAPDAAVFTLSVRRTTGTPPPRCSLEKGRLMQRQKALRQQPDERLHRTVKLAGKAELGTNDCNGFDGYLDM